MSDIDQIKGIDPFAEDVEDSVTSQRIHIRVQQRNGRKSLTTIQGVPAGVDLNKLLRAFKKAFNCNGTIVKDEELGEVIQLQGDQRRLVFQFLVDEKLSSRENIIIHGF
eukprot:TRINITY_DN245_c0_g1_i1.p2 TRINITY_DN245_c0_g1~~TRINITY_DN245_c0_g1_i1.p2  ORF type:complete len:109 (+),score=30.70 TRINITY_DN245_c0_g1_i1:131-457(+)